MLAVWAPAALVFCLAFAGLASVAVAQPVIDHTIRASIDVDSGRLHVVDELAFPSSENSWTFFLNATLEPTVTAGNATLEPVAGSDDDLRLWKLDLASAGRVTLSIVGIPALPGQDPASGHISRTGIYLPPEAGWLPVFANNRVTFSMGATLPKGWTLISQGDEIDDPGGGRAWRELKPQQGIWLVAGPFHKFEAKSTSPRLIAWLRDPDEALAQKYLTAADGWLESYSRHLGPYPYSKFALVENFWETGYAMPSFSLMGSRVLRLPFIVHTAWPHEVLHNWFGNGVFVRGGNWSEGLVAYLADHLVREGSGSGRAFRRDALQKYRNFVESGTEFPVAEFRSRHDPTTAAIGYDKVLMIFHMLRRQLGDDAFSRSLSHLFETWRFRQADWDDVRASFEAISGESHEAFFDQWVTRSGAPLLTVETVKRLEDGCVSGMLRQQDTDAPWKIDVPVYVTRDDGAPASATRITMTGAQQPFSICGDGTVLRVDIDPGFDVMRRLGVRETPASLGELLGSDTVLAVLPASDPEALKARWQKIALDLGMTTALDVDLDQLPRDQNVWIFGQNNRHLPSALDLQPDGTVYLGKNSVTLKNHAVFVARRAGDRVVGVASVPDNGDPEAFIGRLRHYTRYSYLAFGPGERRAGVRGQWPVADSPLTVHLVTEKNVPLVMPKRAPLIGPRP